MVEPRTKASILIVNWNGREHLEACLDSLVSQSFRDFEVILVDNGSVDGSVDFVRGRFPWVRLVLLPENTGFATGNNRGLEQARGDYIVTLNNDTRVEPDWLEVLVEVAESHPRLGMVGCRVCSYADPDVIDSLGMGICRDGMSRGRFRHRRWSSLRLQEVEEILFPSACAALYRRAMLQEIGFFDDEFFAYAEDSDLGLRGRLAGWDAVLATRAVVYHKYSQTGGGFSPFKVHLVERNHYWVALKTFPANQLLAVPFFTLVRYYQQLRVVLSGSGSGEEFLASGSGTLILKALLRGLGEGILGIPRMLGKRRQIMQQKKISGRDLAALLRRYRITFRELLDHD
ncbi:glycosyltransferase family 2 protein [Trichloromonas sp.]|uniref:glycosyltransferase family 2 protein n=1 Tax=Trichloromonas sp. TaxID=3069249 RepID=UPI003D8151D0